MAEGAFGALGVCPEQLLYTGYLLWAVATINKIFDKQRMIQGTVLRLTAFLWYYRIFPSIISCPTGVSYARGSPIAV